MVTGPLSIETLLGVPAIELRARYWDRRPLVAHGGLDRLTAVANEAVLHDAERLIAAHRGPIGAYFRGAGDEVRELEVDPRQAGVLLDSGACLLLMEIDAWCPSVARWGRALASDLGLPDRQIRMSAFIAPEGGVLRKHLDEVHVVSVQIVGRKAWQVEANPQLPAPTENHNPPGELHPDLKVIQTGEIDPEMAPDAESFVMESGSALFVPRGAWHGTEAQTFSISLSFGFDPPTWLDLALEGLRERLLPQGAWRESVWVGRGDRERRVQAEERLRGLLGGLAEAAAELDAGGLIDRVDRGPTS